MAIGNFPVWPFPANWSEEVRETLEWLTDVIQSPTGAEQRRALRKYPRRMIEFNSVFRGPARALFDNLMMQHGGRDWYLPLWIEAHVTSAIAIAGGDLIPCTSAIDGEFFVGDVIFINAGDPFKFELAEIEAIASNGIQTVGALASSWPPGTMIYPMRKARFTDQPAPTRNSDNHQGVQVRFMVSQNNNQIADPETDLLIETYRGNAVLSTPPNERESLEYAYDRMLEETDNQTGMPYRRDTANLAFTTQGHKWVLKGRDQNKAFRAMVYYLKGRAIPIWIPTFFQDIEPVENTPAGETYIYFKNIGFSASGGMTAARRDICIEMIDGTRLFRRILSSTVLPNGNEAIGLDAVFPTGLNIASVLRISFMALFRLDQDQIEIVHHTDNAGISEVSTTFRSAPALRQEVT